MTSFRSSHTPTRCVVLEANGLTDPLWVFLQDLKPGHARLTVQCSGEAWSTLWTGLRSELVPALTVMDPSYLAQRLARAGEAGAPSDGPQSFVSIAARWVCEAAAAGALADPNYSDNMNGALCDFAVRWMIDGDYMRCRCCERNQLATYSNHDFLHAPECTAKDRAEDRPWQVFARLVKPILSAAA